MTDLKSVNFEIFGKVQGVFFRKYTRENAKKLGLCGYVQNTSRGTVVGLIEGKPAAVNKMKEWLAHTGSPKSKIDHANFSPEKAIKHCSFKGFDVVTGNE